MLIEIYEQMLETIKYSKMISANVERVFQIGYHASKEFEALDEFKHELNVLQLEWQKGITQPGERVRFEKKYYGVRFAIVFLQKS
jgi:hypothetical protein